MTRTLSLTTVILISLVQLSAAQAPMKWKIHDLNRPLPPIVDPGTASTQDAPGRAPSDAVVLFDGKDLSHWVSAEGGGPAKWKVENGYVEVVAKTGYIATRDSFGDCQLHVEFAEPSPGVGESQERGNSGVFLMGTYEIQVLDSYENKTYADGQASAVYGQYPPLVNASRPPAQWQTYDIIFHRPHFKDGKVTQRQRASQCCITVCWCKTTWNSPDQPHTASVLRTSQDQTNYRCSCRITATPCATATFGFVSCKKGSERVLVAADADCPEQCRRVRAQEVFLQRRGFPGERVNDRGRLCQIPSDRRA